HPGIHDAEGLGRASDARLLLKDIITSPEWVVQFGRAMGPETTITAGNIDISPQRPLPLAGFGDRTGLSEGTSDALELNGLLIRTADRTLAILTADLLFVTDQIKHRILADVGTQLSLSESSLLFAASHTHFAPAVDASKPRL